MEYELIGVLTYAEALRGFSPIFSLKRIIITESVLYMAEAIQKILFI